MLNKQDLSTIESLMDRKFQQELTPIKDEIQKIRSEQKEGIQKIRVELKDEIRPLKEDIQKIRADQKTIITFFDKEYLELRKRVELIENHLGISSRN